jgi:hypothetical protein
MRIKFETPALDKNADIFEIDPMALTEKIVEAIMTRIVNKAHQRIETESRILVDGEEVKPIGKPCNLIDQIAVEKLAQKNVEQGAADRKMLQAATHTLSRIGYFWDGDEWKLLRRQ